MIFRCGHDYPWMMEGNTGKCAYCDGRYKDGTKCNGGKINEWHYSETMSIFKKNGISSKDTLTQEQTNEQTNRRASIPR